MLQLASGQDLFSVEKTRKDLAGVKEVVAWGGWNDGSHHIKLRSNPAFHLLQTGPLGKDVKSEGPQMGIRVQTELVIPASYPSACAPHCIPEPSHQHTPHTSTHLTPAHTSTYKHISAHTSHQHIPHISTHTQTSTHSHAKTHTACCYTLHVT